LPWINNFPQPEEAGAGNMFSHPKVYRLIHAPTKRAVKQAGQELLGYYDFSAACAE
jgi:hypothetical protein